MHKAVELVGKFVGKSREDGLKAVLDCIEEDLQELIKSRKPKLRSSDDDLYIASILDELHQKAKVVANLYNRGRKDKDKIDPNFFKKYIMYRHENLYKIWVSELVATKYNRSLLKQYPKAAVKPEGFKKLKEAIKAHNRKLLSELINGIASTGRRKGKKFSKDYVEYDYCHDNIRPYWTDPDLENIKISDIQVAKNG